jgi:hypothetical protein
MHDYTECDRMEDGLTEQPGARNPRPGLRAPSSVRQATDLAEHRTGLIESAPLPPIKRTE